MLFYSLLWCICVIYTTAATAAKESSRFSVTATVDHKETAGLTYNKDSDADTSEKKLEHSNGESSSRKKPPRFNTTAGFVVSHDAPRFVYKSILLNNETATANKNSKQPHRDYSSLVFAFSVQDSITLQNFPYKYEASSLGIFQAHTSTTASRVENNCKKDGGICVDGGKGMFYWTANVTLDDNASAPVIFDQTIRNLTDLFNSTDSATIKEQGVNLGIKENWGVSVFKVATKHSALVLWDPEVAIDLGMTSSSGLQELSGISTAGDVFSQTSSSSSNPKSSANKLTAAIFTSIISFFVL